MIFYRTDQGKTLQSRPCPGGGNSWTDLLFYERPLYSLLVVAGIAGAEQYHNTFPGYGQGAEGYAKRLASTYADTVASRMLGSAVFPVLLHQDPRYFYRGSGTVRSRLVYAIISAVVTRGDNSRP